jgi:hypothetical protein
MAECKHHDICGLTAEFVPVEDLTILFWVVLCFIAGETLA